MYSKMAQEYFLRIQIGKYFGFGLQWNQTIFRESYSLCIELSKATKNEYVDELSLSPDHFI